MSNSIISGLVFGNEGGKASAIVKVEGVGQIRLRGTRDAVAGIIDLANGDDSLRLRRVASQKTAKHPAATGTLVTGGKTYAVSAWLNELDDGTRVLGLGESTLPKTEHIW